MEKKELTDKERDEESIKLLKKLKEQLYSADASSRRRSAYKLSWMQEDGLEILKTILLSDVPVTTKNAAAYGMRKMRGRMKKMAREVLEQGMNNGDNRTSEICRNALQMLGEKVPPKSPSKKRPAGRIRIKEISHKSRPRRRIDTRHTRR